MSNPKPLVVYHKLSDTLDCSDGFGAAFSFWLKYGDDFEYMPAFYYRQIPIETFVDRDVYFVDFAYSAEYMDEIWKVAHLLFVLDHHKTAMLSLGTKGYAHIDMSKSGAMLAWNYVFPDKAFPVLLMHVYDHDLHLNQDADTPAFIQRLRNLPTDFNVWKDYMERLEDRSGDDYTAFLHDGKLLLNEHNRRCEVLAASAFPIMLAGIDGLAVNANKFYYYDVGQILAERSKTFGASFYFRPDGNVEFSLTSVGDFDVEKLAFRYNGGGHLHAAGFSISIPSFSSIVDLSSKNVSFYLTLQTYIEDFCRDYSAPTYSAEASRSIASDLAVFLSQKLGCVVDDLEIHVTADEPKANTFKMRSAWFIAKMFGLPNKDAVKKWYHRILPYKIRHPITFDDTQISELLELAKTSQQTETPDFVVNNLLQTVKQSYEAALPDLTLYDTTIRVCFPNSSFCVQHFVTF